MVDAILGALVWGGDRGLVARDGNKRRGEQRENCEENCCGVVR